MKETIDNIRYLTPTKGHICYPSITCDINGVPQEPRFLTISEFMNIDQSSGQQREDILRRIAERQFHPLNRAPKRVEISGVRFLTHRWQPTSGNTGFLCRIDGVEMPPRQLSALMYAEWKDLPEDRKPEYERRMVEFLYRSEIAQILAAREKMAVHLKGDLYREQMLALMQKAGLYPTPHFLERLDEKGLVGLSYVKGDDGSVTRHYKNLVLLADGNRAVDIITGTEAIYNYKNTTLGKLLGSKMVSDAQVTDTLADGKRYVSCRINGVAQSPKSITPTLAQKFDSGVYDAVQVAVHRYYNEMIATEKEQRVEVDMGYRVMDGKNVTYHGGGGEYGFYYKDSEAFDRKQGVCYISESAMEDYDDAIKNGRTMDIREFGCDYNEILTEAREHAFREPEKQAERVFKRADGYGISVEMEQLQAACDESELMTTQEELRAKFNWFIQEHGKRPNYAQVVVRWNDDDRTGEYAIALNKPAGEYADDEVLFTCKSPEGFFRLETADNGEDFRIIELVNYSSGTFEGQEQQQKTNDIIAVERENDWGEDAYIILIRDNGTGDGCYVKPDGTIYDSTTGLNGQRLSDVLGGETATKVMQMPQFQILDLATDRLTTRNTVSDMVVKKKGEFPFEKGMLRCKINGEQQSWRDITLREYRNVVSAGGKAEREAVKETLVNKYFANVLRENQRQEQHQSTGLKR